MNKDKTLVGFVSLLVLLTATPTQANPLSQPADLIEAETGNMTLLSLPGLPTQPAVSSTVLFQDDFNDGLPGAWTYGSGVSESGNCGYNSASRALYFGGTTSRFAQTAALDVTKGMSLQFYVRHGTATGGGPCDRPEPEHNDNMQLQFSINGGSTWHWVANLYAGSHGSWSLQSYALPEEARTTATIFRWAVFMHAPDPLRDHWAVDDVKILGDTDAPEILTQNPKRNEVTADPNHNVVVRYQDRDAGVDVSSIQFFVDLVDRTSQASITSSQLSYNPPLAWSSGTHTLQIIISDEVGNTVSDTWTFRYSPTSTIGGGTDGAGGGKQCAHENQAMPIDGSCAEDVWSHALADEAIGQGMVSTETVACQALRMMLPDCQLWD